MSEKFGGRNASFSPAFFGVSVVQVPGFGVVSRGSRRHDIDVRLNHIRHSPLITAEPVQTGPRQVPAVIHDERPV